MARILEPAAAPGRGPGWLDAKRAGRRLVLLADDNSHLRCILSDLLRHHGYATLEAGSGEEAVRMAREACPDLVVMDLRMPGMDGVEAVRVLRSMRGMERVPVLMLTIEPDTASWERAVEAGCGSYLLKPCRNEDLLREVHRLLGDDEAAGAGH